MSLEQSSNDAPATTSSSLDSVDHSSGSSYNGNGNINEVFTKFKDWDLTQTKSYASNDNVNGDFCENRDTVSNGKIKMDKPKIKADVPDSWGIVMSIKRALWPNEEINHRIMSNTGKNSGKKARQIVLYIESRLDKKKALMTLLNETNDCQGTIIYVREDQQANFIETFLSELKYPTVSLLSHYDKPKQEKALEDFKEKKVKILVGTSAASFGKDLSEVQMVINYDLPNTGEEYLQRIGRVDQSDIPDKVISFFDPKCDSVIAYNLLNILEEAGQKVPPFLPCYCIADQKMVQTTDEDENPASNPN